MTLVLTKGALGRFGPLAALTGMSIVGATLIYTLWWSPVQQRLADSEERYRVAKRAQTALHRARVEQVRARAAQRKLEQARQALPTHEEFTSLGMALSELGRSEHVAIPGMAYEVKKTEGDQPAKATITFRASGDYAAIYQFVRRLETVNPYVVVESLDVAREHRYGDSSSGRVAISVRVATYVRQADQWKRS